MRQCLGCKRVFPKRELLRLVKLPGGALLYDHTQQAHGRGGYVCPEIACFRKAFKAKNPRFSLAPADMQILVEEIKRHYAAGIERSAKRAAQMGYAHDSIATIKDGYPFKPALMRDLKFLERLSSEVL